MWLGDEFPVAQANEKGEELAAFLNQWWTENLEQRFQLETSLEIEYETHYSRFLMPTIRNSEKGTKKRYAGLKRALDGTEKMVFKGLENVRTDWTPLARELQEQMYERIFKQQEWKTLLKSTVEQLKAGELDDKLIYRKRIRQRLDQYVKNKPPHVQAGLKAECFYEQLGQPSPYHSGSYIEYMITVNGAETVEFLSSALDYQHYLDKQVRPVAEAIMQFLGESFDDLVAPQIKLF